MLIEALSSLPWQFCLALAPISFLVFHAVAGLQIQPVKDVQHLGVSLLFTMLKTGGMFFQYLAPIFLLVAGLVSWVQRRRRHSQLDAAQVRGATAPLNALSWTEFEQLVGAYFERQGYSINFTAAGADGGVDIAVRRGEESFLVQCKQWRGTKVGVSVVRELFGVMVARGATGGYVISIGEFTNDALAFASGRNIKLVDAHELLVIPRTEVGRRLSSVGPHDVLCPRCGARMVRRTSQRGRNSGRPFWGCSTFPICRGTRPMEAS